MRIVAALVGVLMTVGCSAGEVEAGPAGVAPQQGGKTGGAVKGNSEVRWDGNNAGELRFTSAACMVMNGKVINFYAPAEAKDNLGDPVLPQINGTEAGKGWVVNAITASNVIFSGSGEASVATDRELTITGKLLDGISAANEKLETVTATFTVKCTDIDDLGNF